MTAANLLPTPPSVRKQVYTADRSHKINPTEGANTLTVLSCHRRRCSRRLPTPASQALAPADDGEELSWEEAGCLLWDVAAVPDDAAFLLNHGLPAMLPPLLTAAAARERWRALEIALGTAANLACHDDARRQLVELEGFPALLLDRLLWVDDVGSLTEVCRCASALLAAGFGGEVGAGHSGAVGIARPVWLAAGRAVWRSVGPAHHRAPSAVEQRLVPCSTTCTPRSPSLCRRPRLRLLRPGGCFCCERRRWAVLCGWWRTRSAVRCWSERECCKGDHACQEV